MNAQRLVALAAVICTLLVGNASAATLDLLTGQAGVIDHYPGLDGLIGTGDDLISGAPSGLNGSDPNSPGALSYNAFDFGNGVGQPEFPPGMNAITFINGSVDIDPGVAQLGGGPLVTAMNVSGTQPFPGHGPYTAQITTVNGGSYDALTGAMTLDVDFTTNLAGGTANAVGFTVSGEAWFLEAADFGNGTGNSYVDNVLIPLAQANNAGSLFFAAISGVVPQSTGGNGGFFPQMPIQAVLVGIAPVPLPPALLLFAGALGMLMRRGLKR